VMAAAYWDTRDNARRILPSHPGSEWGGTGSTRISEYAGMVAGAGSGREWGSHSFAYDSLGSNLAVTGRPMENSLSEGSVSGATTLAAVRDNLFDKLGVGGSWPTTTWGTGATISLTDMGRIGIALAHGGWWNGEQVLDPEWVYWMTHPHWEDGTTSYGMFLWLNHRGNASGIGGTLSASGAGPLGGDPFAPAAVWQNYPHPPPESPDSNPGAGPSCEQRGVPRSCGGPRAHSTLGRAARVGSEHVAGGSDHRRSAGHRARRRAGPRGRRLGRGALFSHERRRRGFRLRRDRSPRGASAGAPSWPRGARSAASA